MDGDLSAWRKRGVWRGAQRNSTTSHPSSRLQWVLLLPGTSCLEMLGVLWVLFPSGQAVTQLVHRRHSPSTGKRRENLSVFSPALQINNFAHRSDCWIFAHLKLRIWRACFSSPVWLTGWVIANLVHLHWTRGSKGRGSGLPLPVRVGLRLNSKLPSQLPPQLCPLPLRFILGLLPPSLAEWWSGIDKPKAPGICGWGTPRFLPGLSVPWGTWNKHNTQNSQAEGRVGVKRMVR